jgi:hypothetical protein
MLETVWMKDGLSIPLRLLSRKTLQRTIVTRSKSNVIIPTKPEVLHFYRECIRTCNGFPVERLRTRLKYNIRELFELHRHESNIDRVQTYLQEGQHQLSVFRMISKWNRDITATLFE